MRTRNLFLEGNFLKQLFFMPLLSLMLFTNLNAQKTAIIDLDSTHQIIRGFGAANILPWRPDMTDAEIETAFGTGEGQLGFTILRLMIEPTSSSWNRNLHTAKKAHDLGVLIFASPWNAPSEMLETVSGLKRVRYDKYQDYAYHLDDFNIFMEDNGVPIYAISVQNEPDYGDWTRWTAQEMLTFMRDYASLIGTRVMAPESFQFRHGMSDPLLNDSLACSNLGLVGGHIYGGGTAPYPLAESKGKEIWMTEHYTDSQNSGNLWPLALNVGIEMHYVMTAGMNAYVWWYIVRFYGPISDGTNDSGNKGDVTKRGYIMSQYSRFIRPGYFRIQCDSYPQTMVYASAYKGGTPTEVVIVAINYSTEAKNQTFAFQNGHVGKFTPYVTSETQDCDRENDIVVLNDSLHATLEAKSITTFVSGGNAVTVENSSSRLKSYKLDQNYPNPFNPTTQINFEIPEKSFVSLKVYNLLGKEVAELAGEEYGAGTHSLIFDAARLANGIYFYTLKTGGFISTRKMIILR
jgi:glucuronoarabinoxylan endo-1,4-beta-xylanase